MAKAGWKGNLKPLEEIDWSKKNNEWENICIVGGSVLSNRQSRAATKAFIKAKLSLNLTDAEQRFLVRAAA
jgi:DNA sulfur modification protein DndB